MSPKIHRVFNEKPVMSLRLKTILGVGIIEAISLIILITTVLNYMRLTSEESLENYVTTTTKLFATTTKDAVLSFDLASLQYFAEDILGNQGLLYARIFDSDNNLLAKGGDAQYVNTPFQLDNNFQDVDDSIYDANAFILVNGTRYGRIEMGFSIEEIEKSVSEARWLAATIAIVEMLLVALFSFILGVYLTKQLKVLRNSARQIAAGDLDQEINITENDEIGEVAHSFNTMVLSLKEANKKSSEYLEELSNVNKHLEDRVQQRTNKILRQKDKLESAYQQLKNTQEQLVQSEKMASIGQLAAGVAHEINNPVAFVKSNLSSLSSYINTYQELLVKQQAVLDKINNRDDVALQKEIESLEQYKQDNDVEFINEDIQTLVSESIDGTQRVSEIVQGLKVYSRASDELMQQCDINVCLQDTLKMLNNELKYNCEVLTQYGDLPLLSGNQGKLTQVFTNLIVNAIQSMDGNGTLTVNTAVTEGNICIVIRDTGKGISKENMSKLFDPFFTTKAVGEGTGLGLSISQGIINDHNGTISVKSEVGQGSSFIIHLPISE